MEVIIYTLDLIKQWLFNKIVKQESYSYTFSIRDDLHIIVRLTFIEFSRRDVLGVIMWAFTKSGSVSVKGVFGADIDTG